jgi:hypothetical protein
VVARFEGHIDVGVGCEVTGFFQRSSFSVRASGILMKASTDYLLVFDDDATDMRIWSRKAATRKLNCLPHPPLGRI